MENRICFLSYLNRSGSTLLAKKLDEFRDISVSIEAEIPDGLRKGSLPVNNLPELDQYLDLLYRNKKFSNWGINREKLRNVLKETSFPINFRDILYTILFLYFSNDRSKLYIYKRNIYYWYYKSLRLLFPGCKILFIIRDPRALFNSQKKAISTIDNKPMQNSPVRFAIWYKKVLKFIYNNLMGKSYFMLVRYEELVLNEVSVISKILKFLEVSSKKKSDSRYKERIPREQTRLHPNIRADIMRADRVKSWENELAVAEKLFLGRILVNEIVKLGYNSTSVQCTVCFNDYLKYLLYRFYYIILKFIDEIKQIVKLVINLQRRKLKI